MKIAIVGAGIGGLALAQGLQRLGLNHDLYEAAPTMRAIGSGITLAPNGLEALRVLGCEQDVKEVGQVIETGAITNEKLRTIASAGFESLKSKYGHSLMSFHRAELQEALLSGLDVSRLRTGHQLLTFEEGERTRLVFENGHSESYDLVFGADGLRSRVRQQLFPKSVLHDPKHLSWRGICVDPTAEQTFANGFSLEAWGSKRRIGLVSLSKSRVYWFAVCQGVERRNAPLDADELIELFDDFDPVFREIVLATPKASIVETPILDLEPLVSWGKSNVILIGDAAHAVSPYMGQGANQALEDAATVFSLLKKKTPMERLLKLYQQQREKKALAVLRLSRRLGTIGHIGFRPARALRDFALRAATARSGSNSMDWLFRFKSDQSSPAEARNSEP